MFFFKSCGMTSSEAKELPVTSEITCKKNQQKQKILQCNDEESICRTQVGEVSTGSCRPKIIKVIKIKSENLSQTIGDKIHDS